MCVINFVIVVIVVIVNYRTVDYQKCSLQNSQKLSMLYRARMIWFRALKLLLSRGHTTQSTEAHKRTSKVHG